MAPEYVHILIFFVALIVSLTFHEAAHATLAYLGGDRTAYEGGQVSLNPIPHIRREPFGMVVLPLLILVSSKGLWCAGYASTPINPHWAEAHPRRAALVALAGPLSNFLLAAVAFAILKIGIGAGWFEFARGAVAVPADGSREGALYATTLILRAFLLLNLLLGLLNLFPIPPLDGASVVRGFFPATAPLFGFLQSNPLIMLGMMLLVIFVLLRRVFWPVYSAVVSLLGP